VPFAIVVGPSASISRSATAPGPFAVEGSRLGTVDAISARRFGALKSQILRFQRRDGAEMTVHGLI
jgi:hypothetical protein